MLTSTALIPSGKMILNVSAVDAVYLCAQCITHLSMTLKSPEPPLESNQTSRSFSVPSKKSFPTEFAEAMVFHFSAGASCCKWMILYQEWFVLWIREKQLLVENKTDTAFIKKCFHCVETIQHIMVKTNNRFMLIIVNISICASLQVT